MTESDFIVTLSDARACKLCMTGSRAWAKAYGLSWDEFIQNGIPASKLIALNDAYADRIVAQARKRLGIN